MTLTSLQSSELSLFVIGVIICIVLFVIHAIRLHEDLFTVDRKSVSHRNAPPAISSIYRAQQYLILCSLAAATLLLAGLIISDIIAYTSSDEGTFFVVGVIASFFFSIVKASQYAVFMLKLHHLYRDTEFRYSTKLLWVIFSVGFLNALYPTILYLVHYLLGPAIFSKFVTQDDDGTFRIDFNVLYIIPYRMWFTCCLWKQMYTIDAVTTISQTESKNF